MDNKNLHFLAKTADVLIKELDAYDLVKDDYNFKIYPITLYLILTYFKCLLKFKFLKLNTRYYSS